MDPAKLKTKNFLVQGKKIKFSNGKVLSFNFSIISCLDFEKAIVVLFSCPADQIWNENVIAFSYKGAFLWQVPRLYLRRARNPFVRIKRDSDCVVIENWRGIEYRVFVESGLVLDEGRFNSVHAQTYQNGI